MLRPLHDFVVVERDPEEDLYKGRLVIPEGSKEAPQKGTIVAVGPGTFLETENFRRPMGVKVGDRVLFGKYSGIETTLDEKKYIIMRESEILGLL